MWMFRICAFVLAVILFKLRSVSEVVSIFVLAVNLFKVCLKLSGSDVCSDCESVKSMSKVVLMFILTVNLSKVCLKLYGYLFWL